MNPDDLTPRHSNAGWFNSTHWSVVLAAKEGDAATASEALEKLCRTYWPPLYAYIRREGHSDAEAQDLTQEFFLRLVSREFLQHLRHQRGKFRSFLLTFLKHFLSEQRGKASAQKRGGGKVIVSLDELTDRGSFLHEPVDGLSPDRVFELRWDTQSGQPITESLETGDWTPKLVSFDRTGRRMATGGKDGVLRVWSVPAIPSPVPEWFLTLAETVAGMRLGDRGQLELVSPAEFESAARNARSADKNDFYARLAEWFLADPTDRETAPF